MGRLSLAIADTDTAYLGSVVDFLSTNYSQRFRLSSFTNGTSLNKYLDENEEIIDILLVNPQICLESIPRSKFKVLILLTEGRLPENISAQGYVSKYQHGDRLASSIINIYSEVNNEIVLPDGEKSTRIAVVYSPAGGTGKTTVAISLCTQSAQMGLKVFYLNLETIDSTSMFFECNDGPNLSNIFYYLREKNNNLRLKIEGIRCIDSGNGIHFFSPPDSAEEKEELLPSELENLIDALKHMHFYDVVFIDMASSVNRVTQQVLKMSDDIFLVFAQSNVSNAKTVLFKKELDILKERSGLNINNKTKLILNKFNSATAVETKIGDLFEISEIYKLPYLQQLVYERKISHILAGDNNFSQTIKQLAGMFG